MLQIFDQSITCFSNFLLFFLGLPKFAWTTNGYGTGETIGSVKLLRLIGA
jgi:hypothetical protein